MGKLEELLKENALRFGAGTALKQLEVAKRGADYDLALASVSFNFVMAIK